jgi:hypothetical protein
MIAMINYIFLMIVFLLVSCDNKTRIKHKDTSEIQNLSEPDVIPSIDTTIVLKEMERSNFNRENSNM